MGKIITIAFFLFCLSLIKAQDKSMGSITTVDSLYEVAKELRRTNTNEALSITDKIYNISKEINYNAGLLKSLRLMTYLHYYKGELDKSFKYIYEALDISNNMKDLESIGKAENIIGMLHRHLKEYEKAIAHYEKSLHSFKEINNQKEIH